MNHTPGPWEYVGDDDDSWNIKQVGSDPTPGIVDTEAGGVVGCSEWIWLHPDNAKLIVAAPEMFDVLEKLVHGPAHKLYETVAEAHKILKRIKGEE